jgi:phosphatidylglycerol:prolipoprotein diacylglycerol transferase
MHPVLFKISHFSVSSYSFFLSLGFIAALLFSFFESSKKGIEQNDILFFFLILFFSLIIAGRIVTLLINRTEGWLFRPVDILTFWKEGRSSWAGAIIGILAGLLYTRKKRIALWKFADTLTPGLLIGISIAKLGCLMSGCCNGKPADCFWAITIHGVERHPVQLYQMIFCLLIFSFIMLIKKRIKFDGGIFLISFGILYPVARIIEEHFRAHSLQIFSNVSLTVFLCSGCIIVALILIWKMNIQSI